MLPFYEKINRNEPKGYYPVEFVISIYVKKFNGNLATE